MRRNLFLLAIAALWITSCGGEGTTDATTQVTLAQFESGAAEYVGKTVSITGTVDHVCRHGGKKMFIVSEGSGERLKITATSDVGSFDVALEGSNVRVEGIVEVLKVDESYLANWEGEVCAAEGLPVDAAEGEHQNEAAETAVAEGAEAAEEQLAEATDKEQSPEELKQINSLREQLTGSGEEYLAFYSLACSSFEEIN
jgi:hypothetical protein